MINCNVLRTAFLISLTVLFFIASHFYMTNTGGTGLSITFNIASWFVMGITLGVGGLYIAYAKSVQVTPLVKICFVGVLLLTLPLLYSASSLTETWPRFVALWLGLCFFFFLHQFNFKTKQIEWLLFLIVGCAFLQALLAIVQVGFLQPGNIFDFDTTETRPQGIFQQINVLSTFLVTGFMVAGYLLPKIDSSSLQKQLMLTVIFSLTVLVIPLVFVIASRTGWIGLVLGSILLLPYIIRQCSRGRLILWFIAIALGLLSIFVLESSSKSDSGVQVTESEVSVVHSKFTLSDIRGTIYPQVLSILVDNVPEGIGYGNFHRKFITIYASKNVLEGSDENAIIDFGHPHNEILYWGVEGGLVALLGLLVIAAGIVWGLCRVPNGNRLVLLALILPLSIHCMLELPFYHSALSWFAFIIIIFVISQSSSVARVYSVSRAWSRCLTVPSILLPIVLGGYLLLTLQANYFLVQFLENPKVGIAHLDKALYPAWFSNRYAATRAEASLREGIKSKNKEKIISFIMFAMKDIKYRPRGSAYFNLVVAYSALGDKQSAAKAYKEGILLFPVFFEEQMKLQRMSE